MSTWKATNSQSMKHRSFNHQRYYKFSIPWFHESFRLTNNKRKQNTNSTVLHKAAGREGAQSNTAYEKSHPKACFRPGPKNSTISYKETKSNNNCHLSDHRQYFITRCWSEMQPIFQSLQIKGLTIKGGHCKFETAWFYKSFRLINTKIK